MASQVGPQCTHPVSAAPTLPYYQCTHTETTLSKLGSGLECGFKFRQIVVPLNDRGGFGTHIFPHTNSNVPVSAGGTHRQFGHMVDDD